VVATLPTIGDFGRYVRAQRVALGLSQAEFAVRVGVAQQTLSALETGERAGTALTRFRIAKALNSELDDMLDAAGAGAAEYESLALIAEVLGVDVHELVSCLEQDGKS
jgi:transcriptional regulator with XRE-family HTH domain